MKDLASFVKERRKDVNLTQQEFAEKTGVALTVLRKIEQGKTNLNLDKVNLVLSMFGHELAPVDSSALKTKMTILELARKGGIENDLDLEKALNAQRNISFSTEQHSQINESNEILEEMLKVYFKKRTGI